MLTEARGFLLSKGEGAKFWHFVMPGGYPTSMIVYSWQSSVVGFSAAAANLVQFGLLGLCTAAGYGHLRQLGIERSTAILASLLWMLSFPALSAAFWQATQHDKLAFLFMMLALSMSLHALRMPRSSAVKIVVASATAAVVLAVASKPIAFMLPGILIVQVILFYPSWPGSSYRRAAALIAAPAGYAALYSFVYLASMTDVWRAHTTGGPVGRNLAIYLRYLGNADYDALVWPAALLSAPIAIAWLWALWRTTRRLQSNARVRDESFDAIQHRQHVRVYLCALLVAGLVIVAQARAPAAYYLLVPMFAVTGTLASVADTMRHVGSARRRRAGAALVTLVAAGLLAMSATNLMGERRLGRLTRAARNLTDGYDVIRRTIDPQTVRSLTFILPQAPDAYFYLISGGATHTEIDLTIPSFIFRRDVRVPITQMFDGAHPAAMPGDVVAIWSDDFRLAELRLSGAPVYRSSGR